MKSSKSGKRCHNIALAEIFCKKNELPNKIKMKVELKCRKNYSMLFNLPRECIRGGNLR
jgi:hypothetical protein